MNPEQQQLFREMARQVAELISWKNSKERQQIKYPLDVSSQGVVYKDVLLFKDSQEEDSSPVILDSKTTVGGSATEAFTVTGVAIGDIIFAQVVNDGTNNRTILQASVTAADTVTVVFSGDPGNNLIFSIIAFRPNSFQTDMSARISINKRDYRIPLKALTT